MPLLAISLLAILAGTLLLAKFKKEPAGKFFTFISWFFIFVGFILFIGFAAGGVCRLAHHCCGKDACQQEMMMKQCGPGMPCGPFGHRFLRPGMMGPGMCPPGCPPHPGCMPGDSMMKCDTSMMKKCCPGHKMMCSPEEMKKCSPGEMKDCCKEGKAPAKK
jgi:hypothetical protein